MTTPTLTDLNKDAKALRTIMNSHGWEVLQRTMYAELSVLTNKVMDEAMTPEVLSFHRGAAWAGRQLLKAPEKMLVQLDNQILFETSKNQQPASAGKKEKTS